MKKLIIILGWVLLASYSQAQSNQSAPLPSGYLHRVSPGIPGKVVYICGEHPFNASGELVAAGDLDGQARQVLDNIKTALSGVNMTLDDVAQITYAIKGTSEKVSGDTAQLLSSIGAEYFSQAPKLIDVKCTPKIMRDDILIEVEVVAIK